MTPVIGPPAPSRNTRYSNKRERDGGSDEEALRGGAPPPAGRRGGDRRVRQVDGQRIAGTAAQPGADQKPEPGRRGPRVEDVRAAGRARRVPAVRFGRTLGTGARDRRSVD